MVRSRLLLVTLTVLAACAGDPGGLSEISELDHPEEQSLSGEGIASSFLRAGDGYLVSHPSGVVEGATRVAAMLTLEGSSAGADGAIEVRGLDASGAAGPWVRAEGKFREGELSVVSATLPSSAVQVQLRMPEGAEKEIALLTWSASAPADEEPADADDGVGRGAQGLAADLASNGILPRSAWGARAPRCSSRDRAKVRMAVHHTVTARGGPGGYESVLRQIQAFHMDGRGYCDVGYHFFVTADGRVWEARDLDTLGAHSGNYNSGNIGIVFVGCFDASGTCDGLGGREVPDAMMAGAAKAIAGLSRRHGIAIDGDRVKGHGEQPYQQTSCPGSALRARLEELRSRARSGGGGGGAPPAVVRPAPPPPAHGPSPATRRCGGIGSNELLARGEDMRACGAPYRLAHQQDGNVVLYRTDTGKGVWATGTAGRDSTALVMQWDGNLVLYGRGNAVLWASGTDHRWGAALAVQDDGNLVIYDGGTPAWASDTAGAGAPCGSLRAREVLGRGEQVVSCNGAYRFVHQADGNVVLYRGASALWASRTVGKGSDALIMQGDGNLVLYAAGRAVWSSGTAGRSGAWLAVQDDGNAVLYAGGAAVWATRR